MRNLTGGNYDDEYTEKPQPVRPVSPDSPAVHMSPDSPKHDDEGNSAMEHPFKNEVEIKGIPYPMPMYGGGGYCGHGGGWGGDGFGGGIGGLLVGALLGRGGFGGFGGGWGGGWGGGCGGWGGERVLDTAILQQLGNVQATVPLTALQTQAQIAESTGDINLTTLQQTLQLQQSINSAKDATQNGTFFLNNAVQNVNTAVNSGTLATAIAIRDDGDKTRELINSIDRQNLSRQLAVAENTIVELRQGREHDHRAHGVEIQMTNNQNQNQLQFQAQAQALGVLQHGLFECNQIARATNQNVLVGNQGVTTTGPQTANPTNVKV